MPFRGWSDPCWSCPLHGAYTTYAAAQQCDVQKLDLLCNTGEVAGGPWWAVVGLWGEQSKR